MSSYTEVQTLKVEINEKEILTAEIIEKEIITVNLNIIDVLAGRSYITETVKEYWILNEVPSKVSIRRFRTANAFVSGTLVVYLNGIKERYVSEVTNTDFDLPIDSVSSDDIEVSYIKQ